MTSRTNATNASRNFTFSDEIIEEESPRWSGHGKRIPHGEINNYSMGVSQAESQLTSRSAQDRALGIKRTKSQDSQAMTETSEQFAETEVIGIVSIDGEGTILFANAKCCAIFDEPNLTGQSIHDYVPNNYFGTDQFQELHRVMIKAFFAKQFAGGRMLDPGTILRAKLRNGKLVPLNVGLEAKLEPDGTPRIVIAYITEAGQIIDQSKVEKMLSRATLVVLQQFISQAILSAIGFWELIYVPPLRYPSEEDDDFVKLETCKDYTFNKLTLDGDQGDQDYKMMLYVLSSAMTILISVLPLFVNHMNDHSGDGATDDDNDHKKKKSLSRQFRDFANAINDAQEYLSTIKTMRKTDIVSLVTIVCTTNLFLLYELKSLPNEYEIHKVKECEQMAQDELNISIAMCALGAIPVIYFIIKMMYKWIIHGCHLPRWHQHPIAPESLYGSSHGSSAYKTTGGKISRNNSSMTFKKFESRASSAGSAMNSARSDTSNGAYEFESSKVKQGRQENRLSDIEASIDIDVGDMRVNL